MCSCVLNKGTNSNWVDYSLVNECIYALCVCFMVAVYQPALRNVKGMSQIHSLIVFKDETYNLGKSWITSEAMADSCVHFQLDKNTIQSKFININKVYI